MELLSKALALGLIASSYCWMQLALNLLSNFRHSFGLGLGVGVGCAGFNTVLGPLRPFMRCITLVWLLWNWASCCANANASACDNVNTDMRTGGSGTGSKDDGREKEREDAKLSSIASKSKDCCPQIANGRRKPKPKSRSRSRSKPIASSILYLVLMFSPKMLTYYDRHLKHKLRHRHKLGQVN